MNKTYQKSFSGDKNAGFTLIELLVVVLIIGILAAVALPKYEVAVEKSRIASVLPLGRAVRNAQEVYYLVNGTYTKDPENLGIEIECPKEYQCVFHDFYFSMTPRNFDGYVLYFTYSNSPYAEGANVNYCEGNKSSKQGVRVCQSFGQSYLENEWFIDVKID